MLTLFGKSQAFKTWLPSANIFVVNFTSPNAGDDETGDGCGLAGANLVFTDVGTVAGAVGGCRALDGTNDGFIPTEAWFNGIFAGQTNYFLGIEMVVGAGYDDLDTFVDFQDTDVNLKMLINSDKLRVTLVDTENGSEARDSTDDITTAQKIWVCCFCDGTTSYAGWTVGTRPTKLTDFEANKLITFTALFDNFASLATAVSNGFFYETVAGRYLPGNIYSIYASNTCLIET
jgi:hypothetical protein